MIAIELMGGLGNQMFQYAAGRALADRLGVDLVLDDLHFNQIKPLNSKVTARQYGLSHFNIRAQLATTTDLSRWKKGIGRLQQLENKVHKRLHLEKLNLSISTRLFERRYYQQPSFTYDEHWSSLQDGLYLKGYFQSELFFSMIAESIRLDFTLKRSIDEKNKEIEKKILNSESVCLHVRRGDYLANAQVLAFHGICHLNYYQKAVRFFQKYLHQPQFFVFSDDIDWCRKNLDLNENTIFVDHNGTSPEKDIFLMSQCQHHIIANSSFSWWGAWLAKKPDQQVIAPRQWFGSRNIDSRDLVPVDWMLF
jgi:hypothetical protein